MKADSVVSSFVLSCFAARVHSESLLLGVVSSVDVAGVDVVGADVVGGDGTPPGLLTGWACGWAWACVAVFWLPGLVDATPPPPPPPEPPGA